MSHSRTISGGGSSRGRNPDRIGVARRDYNEKVAEYNISRGHFPGVIFANLFGFQREEEFKVDPAKREVPEVKF